MLKLFATLVLALLGPAAFAADPAPVPVPTRIVVNGVELHYISAGAGDPLILLHGGQGDYRSWEPQMRALARRYRVISYSRRYNFPNVNPQTATDHSAIVEASDLAALIRALKLRHVILVGTSIGAATALTFAVDHPGKVSKLVLAEPPILAWAREFKDGGALYQDFMTRIQDPARAAFAAGDDEGGMRFFVDGFSKPGRFDSLAPEAKLTAMQNAKFFRMMTRSADPYPALSREKVARLRMPVLVITGEKTVEIHRRIDEVLAGLIPRARSATIPNAGHGSPRESPMVFTEVLMEFLSTSN
jgi:pimeloyl-ACP methyl ester carboxylesterase